MRFQFRYETELFGGKICVPSSEALKKEGAAQFKQVFDEMMKANPVTEYFSDIVATQEVLQIGLVLAFVIGFVYMFVLRFFGGPIIFFSIIGIIGGTAYGGWMLYEYSQEMPDSE